MTTGCLGKCQSVSMTALTSAAGMAAQTNCPKANCAGFDGFFRRPYTVPAA